MRCNYNKIFLKDSTTIATKVLSLIIFLTYKTIEKNKPTCSSVKQIIFMLIYSITYLWHCSIAFTWHFRVLKTFRNSCRVKSLNVDILWDTGHIFTHAICMVAFQNIVESVSFLTANINWYPFVSRHFFDLKKYIYKIKCCHKNSLQ